MIQRSKTKQAGTVRKERFYSAALGIEKFYQIYLPPSYFQTRKRYPVLYLFRGHEDEWFNPYQDHSRGGSAVQHLADELITTGRMGEMIVVGVGMTSADGSVYGLGINFLNPGAPGKRPGIGTGRFEDYFTRDLIAHIDRSYRTISRWKGRGADGFSLGGYTAVMLAVKHPRLFASVGSYDGSHMFRNLDDPRYTLQRHNDRLWMRHDAMFAPAFCRPGHQKYDLAYALSYNPLNILDKLSSPQKKRLRSVRFYIKSAAFDDNQGNRDRSVHLVTLFQMHGIINDTASLILSSDAHHTWKFADLHLQETLPKHAAALGAPPLTLPRPAGDTFSTHLEIVKIEESSPQRSAVEIHYHIYREMAVKVEVVNLHGEYVATLKNERHDCGRYQLEWKGKNHRGHWMPSGMYFVLLTPIPESRSVRQKFLLLR